MRLPPLPPLTPTVDYTMDEIQALILAYGNAVREECARVCIEEGKNEGGYEAVHYAWCAEAIRKD